MNKELLKKHIKQFITDEKAKPNDFLKEYKERSAFSKYYQSYTANKIIAMSEEDIYEYLSKLWAMLIWGNKHYLIDKIIAENGLGNFKQQLAQLVWGEQDIALRWDTFKKQIKGMGPAMISEVLCKTHPDEFFIWNRRAYVALKYLEVRDLPRYDYQLTGKVYEELCNIGKEISDELVIAGFKEKTLLAVDYFIWEQLQVIENLTEIFDTKPIPEIDLEKVEPKVSSFIHDDIRDKLSEIGHWLGFSAKTEQKIADGATVDAIWEVTIGNMGRVIYAFEVQTKGSIDSLILNLLKSLNNPAVQGVVAISDKKQLDAIKLEVATVPNLKDKLRYWDYENVLKIHESLEFVNGSINELGLVPQGF
jgi:hypothetical protein